MTNVFSRGDKILILESGRFAVGWGEMATMLGVEAEILNAAPRRAVDPAAVEERLKFVNNAQINDEALSALVDPAGNPSFDDYVFESQLVPEISESDVTAAIRSWIDLEEYIEIRVVPR